MARKPYRHDLLSSELFAAIFSELSPPGSIGEMLAFYEASIAGLLDLLEREKPVLAEAARRAYEWAHQRFGAVVQDERISRASSINALEFAKLSTRYFIAGTRPRDPDPIQLLVEFKELAEEISHIKHRGARERWLMDCGVSRQRLARVRIMSDSDAAEWVLAARHLVSHSKVRKSLAKAPRQIQSLLKRLATKNPL